MGMQSDLFIYLFILRVGKYFKWRDQILLIILRIRLFTFYY